MRWDEGVWGGVALMLGLGAFMVMLVAATGPWHQERIAREQAFCAAKGMSWEHGGRSANGNCVDGSGFAHPISNAVSREVSR